MPALPAVEKGSMRQRGQPPYERFAAAGDALLRGDRPEADAIEGFGPELQLAERLRSSAPAGVPDPEFVKGLGEELRQRARSFSGRGRHSRRDEQAALRYATLETPLGRLGLAYRNARVVYCAAVYPSLPTSLPQGERGDPLVTFERAVAREIGEWPEQDAAAPAPLQRAVRDHLAGRRRFKEVDLSWLKPFQRRVLEKTAQIPRGEVRPYGWIAREIGAPGAVRAVGTALGHNPVPFLIPCHRVVRSDGSLGEYSGGGPAVKERVLLLEGAPVAEIGRGPRYNGCKTTRIVCYPSCHAARRVRSENCVPFASLSQAQASGYRPCLLCRPA